jgi:hypothetical protein
MMGLSNALYSSIRIRQGQIEQGNFTDYLVARLDVTPETHVYIIGAGRRRAASVSPTCPQSRRRFAMRFCGSMRSPFCFLRMSSLSAFS